MEELGFEVVRIRVITPTLRSSDGEERGEAVSGLRE